MNFISTTVIESVEICNNIGAGIQFRLTVSNEQQSQMLVTLSNVTASNNRLPGNTIAYEASIVNAIFITTLVLHNVSITDNNMTGLFIHRTAVVVNGTSVFYNNAGIDGGGLAMYGDSYLVLKENSFLNFTNNRAKKRGGAIFIENQLGKFPCFFRHTFTSFPKSAKVAFIGNKADTAGSGLFGGDITNCDLFKILYYYKNEKLFTRLFNYSAQTGPSVISSEPSYVCFCNDNNTMNCSQTQLTMTAYPGEEVNISVVSVGQLNGAAPASIEMRPLHKEDGKLFKTNAMNCMNIAFKPIYKTYKLNVFEIESFKLIHISLSGCPLGFQISNETKSCDCDELRHTITTITCDATTKMIKRHGNIWIGNISDCLVLLTTATQHRSASLSLILIPSVLSTGLEGCVADVRMGSALLWDPTTVFNVLNSHILLSSFPLLLLGLVW